MIDPCRRRPTQSPGEGNDHITVAEDAKRSLDGGLTVPSSGPGQVQGVAVHGETWRWASWPFSW
ncbi:MAG: hypothetical protein AAGI71_13775 [Bacteroidota bacterium]